MRTWELLKQNPYLFQRYFVKEFLIKACRVFFENRNYHELESPILAPALPQERYLDVLETKIEQKGTQDITAYLIPTTERYNKIILASGLGEHFVITKVARGTEEISSNHSPEFTMLEWYHLNANYKDLMRDACELIQFAHRYIYDLLIKERDIKKFPIDISEYSQKFEYQGTQIDISGEWKRLSIPNGLRQYCKIDLNDIQDEEKFRNVLKQRGYNVSQNDTWQILFELIFASEIEPNISKNIPTFVYDYPKQVCVLTKPSPENPLVCEKAELYLAGKEIANGYTELLDYKLQKDNFDQEKKARDILSLKQINYDYELIDALKSGLPEVAGIGMGLDRLAMIFANAKNISDINYFPVSEWNSFS